MLAAVRLCSLRNLAAGTVGGVLALAPLTSAPSISASLATVPYLPSYPHQAYGYELAQAGWQRNAQAKTWLAAADAALLQPEPVGLPLERVAPLSTQPASSFAFTVAAGRRLVVAVEAERVGGESFVDLFRVTPVGHERVAGANPGAAGEPFAIEVVDGGDYVLRVQSTIGATSDAHIRVEARPLLAFPVDGVDARAIWSGFGAERDGGRRAHRGADIFAARGTPTLAATDSWVTRVETTRVGGNVIWLQPLFGSVRLYYAHLSEQWVKPGDFVRAGQALGAVGNTGNAITTPPHLHFGVYVRQAGRRGGARDPAEFLR